MNGNGNATDLFGRPLVNYGVMGFTSTLMEPQRGSCAIRYPAGICAARSTTTAFQDLPGQNGAGRYTLAEGEANFFGGRVDANIAYWLYTLSAEIVQAVLDDAGEVIGYGDAVTSDVAARVSQNQVVTFRADGQDYDAGYLTNYLENSRAGIAAQGQGFTHDNKLGWPGLRDDKVAFSLNPGNQFSIQLTAIRNDDIDSEDDVVFLVRWTNKGVKWLQGGAAQKR